MTADYTISFDILRQAIMAEAGVAEGVAVAVEAEVAARRDKSSLNTDDSFFFRNCLSRIGCYLLRMAEE